MLREIQRTSDQTTSRWELEACQADAIQNRSIYLHTWYLTVTKHALQIND